MTRSCIHGSTQAVVSFNAMLWGVWSEVQREVNGSVHLLRIVAIVIRKLWVVRALQFVQLEDITICCGSLMALLVSDCWTTFPQHAVDSQICILYINEGVILQRVLRFKSLAALWEMSVLLPCDCLTPRYYIWYVGWGVTASLSRQSINTSCCDWCFPRWHMFTACLYSSNPTADAQRSWYRGFLFVTVNSQRTFVFMGRRLTEPFITFPFPLASAENSRQGHQQQLHHHTCVCHDKESSWLKGEAGGDKRVRENDLCSYFPVLWSLCCSRLSLSVCWMDFVVWIQYSVQFFSLQEYMAADFCAFIFTFYILNTELHQKDTTFSGIKAYAAAKIQELAQLNTLTNWMLLWLLGTFYSYVE